MTFAELKPTRQEMNRRQAIADSIATDAVFEASTRAALLDMISTFGHNMTELDRRRLAEFAWHMDRYSYIMKKGV